MTFTAPNPDYATAIPAMFERIPAAGFIGFTFASLTPGRAVLHLEKRPELLTHIGTFQAAIIGALIDFAGGAACGTVLDTGRTLVSQDYTCRLLAPAQADRLVAVAQVLSKSRSTYTAEVSVYCDMERGTLCGHGTLTCRATTTRALRQQKPVACCQHLFYSAASLERPNSSVGRATD